MTRFITFRDVVLSVENIQSVMIIEDRRKKDVEYLAKVNFTNGEGVSFPYSTEDNAKKAVYEINELLVFATRLQETT